MSMNIIYRPYINFLTWTYVGVCVILDTVMYFFQNLHVILSVSYLISPIATNTVHKLTHKWYTYGHHMKQNVSMVPFVTSKYIYRYKSLQNWLLIKLHARSNCRRSFLVSYRSTGNIYCSHSACILLSMIGYFSRTSVCIADAQVPLPPWYWVLLSPR